MQRWRTSLVSALWQPYMSALQRFPLFTKSASAAVLMGAGDVLAQKIEHHKIPTTHHHDDQITTTTREEHTPAKLDLQRTGRMMLWGFIGAGPIMHYWYRLLDSAVPGASVGRSIVKLVLDQSIAAPTLIGSFFIFAGATEGKSVEEIKRKLEADYWPTMKMNWSVWPIVSFINFRFVPPAQRVLYVSAVSVVWNTYLSLVEHK